MRADTLRVSAYAKINLSLEVLGKRPDGYHEVVTIMQTVDLADEVMVKASDRLSVHCDDESLAGEANIVWDAAVALADRAGVEPRAEINIRKRIPVAAGLGGGSADAAAALRGLNRLWSLDLPVGELERVASRLGADVVFLLTGGTALGVGKGDELIHLAAPECVKMLVVAPAASIPRKTPTMYRSLLEGDFSDGEYTQRLFGSGELARGELNSEPCRNTFTRAALEILPGLRDVWERTGAVVKFPPRLSGAGPALFCMPSDDMERERVTVALQNTGATAYLVRTINPAQVV